MRAIAAAGLIVASVVAGCGGDDLSASEKRYCRLVEKFATPTLPKDSEPEQFTQVMSQYVVDNEAYFAQLIDNAPKEIKPDVEKAIVALRRVAAGGIEAFDDLDTSKADKWEEDHCP